MTRHYIDIVIEHTYVYRSYRDIMLYEYLSIEMTITSIILLQYIGWVIQVLP